MGSGLWIVTGTAFGSTLIFMGGPNIFAMGADDMLKELFENASINQDFNFGTLVHLLQLLS